MTFKEFEPLLVLTRRGDLTKRYVSRAEREAMQKLAMLCELMLWAKELDGPRCPPPDLNTFPEFKSNYAEIDSEAVWLGLRDGIKVR